MRSEMQNTDTRELAAEELDHVAGGYKRGVAGEVVGEVVGTLLGGPTGGLVLVGAGIGHLFD